MSKVGARRAHSPPSPMLKKSSMSKHIMWSPSDDEVQIYMQGIRRLVLISRIHNMMIPFMVCILASSGDVSSNGASGQQRKIDGGKRVSVQIIENWTEIHGTVRSVAPSTDVREFVAVTVAVDRATTLEGFANLLTDVVGKEITVLIPEELARSLDIKQGSVITCRVRKAGSNRIFAHRQHISAHPPPE